MQKIDPIKKQYIQSIKEKYVVCGPNWGPYSCLKINIEINNNKKCKTLSLQNTNIPKNM